MLAEFIHTGVLEMYHGLMAKTYCHKLQHYSYHGMRARTQLAILDHNRMQGDPGPRPKMAHSNTNLSVPRALEAG